MRSYHQIHVLIWQAAEALVGLAHPDNRDELIKEAEKLGIWRKSNKQSLTYKTKVGEMKKEYFKIDGQKIEIEELETHLVSDEKEEDIKKELFDDLVPRLNDLHNRLFAESKHGVLIVLQALDAAGKDEIIK